jgi:hypothetical protein
MFYLLQIITKHISKFLPKQKKPNQWLSFSFWGNMQNVGKQIFILLMCLTASIAIFLVTVQRRNEERLKTFLSQKYFEPSPKGGA